MYQFCCYGCEGIFQKDEQVGGGGGIREVGLICLLEISPKAEKGIRPKRCERSEPAEGRGRVNGEERSDEGGRRVRAKREGRCPWETIYPTWFPFVSVLTVGMRVRRVMSREK